MLRTGETLLAAESLLIAKYTAVVRGQPFLDLCTELQVRNYLEDQRDPKIALLAIYIILR